MLKYCSGLTLDSSINDSSAARSDGMQAAKPVNSTIKYRDKVQNNSLMLIKLNRGISLYDAVVLT
jgi:hypothetical protein